MNAEEIEGEPYPEGFPETPEGIKAFLKSQFNKVQGVDGMHDGCPDWPNNLFTQKEEDRIQFLKKRMATTESRKEYYTAMLFLLHTVPDDELLVPFESAGDSRVCTGRNTNEPTRANAKQKIANAETKGVVL
jgi:hypothetical protein